MGVVHGIGEVGLGGWGLVVDTNPCTNHMHYATTHAPTHARRSLPVNPNPILTPPNIAPSALHDTAAIVYGILMYHVWTWLVCVVLLGGHFMWCSFGKFL